LAVHHTNLIRPRASPFFLFTPPAPTEIYTLSLHDALPIFDDLLLTRVERMAGRAHLDVQVVRERRARLDDVAAAARDRDLPVLGMNVWFHRASMGSKRGRVSILPTRPRHKRSPASASLRDDVIHKNCG